MRETLFFKAFIFSLLINALVCSAGMLSDLAKPLQFLGYFARAVTAPPAFLIGWLIRPRTSSLPAIIGAGIAGLAFSVVFYAVVLWLVLLYMNRSSQKNAE